MSIKLTGDIMFATPTITGLFAGYSKWSYSVFFRYDGTPSSPNGVYFGATAFNIYSNPISSASQAAHPGTVAYGPSMRGADGSVAATPGPVYLAVGSVYHLMLVWDAGLQTAYINSVPTTMGHSAAAIMTTNDLIGVGDSRAFYGGTPASPGRIWSLRDQAMWANYAATATDARNLMLGNNTPATLGTPATFWWPFTGTPGNTVVANDPGLRDSFGHAAYNLSQIHSDGKATSTAVYSDAMAWQPNAHIVAWVNSNGQSVGCFMETNNSGNWTPEVGFQSDPTITIVGAKGGTNIPLTPTPYRPTGVYASTYKGQFYLIPAPYAVVSPSDVVTLSAPVGWVNTQAGIAGAEVNTPVTNYFGRSIYGAESAAKTLKMGFCFPWFIGSPSQVYSPTKNFQFRSWNSGGIAGIDANGKPTAIANTLTANNPAFYTVQFDGQLINGIDNTGMPGPAGLWAVGWDDTGADVVNHPTVLGIAVDTTDGQTCVEQTQYNNPGTVDGAGHRIGIVRVFDVHPGAGKTAVTIKVTYWQNQFTLHFANDFTYGPGDFTPAAPTVLDRSDPYALSAMTLQRFSGGVGSMRFIDSEVDNFGVSNVCEPEHIRRLTDWEWTKANYAWTIPATTVRDWDVTRTPYVYSGIVGGLGQPYTATLSAAVTTAPAPGTIETVTISDASAAPTAATGPVVTGQIITFPGNPEKWRVLSVSDTDGVTTTVERGAVGTPTSTHAAGPITVNYRWPMTMAKWSTSFSPGHVGAVFEVVTLRRHNLQTLQLVPLSAFPATVKASDGYAIPCNGNQNGTWVTGPNTFARVTADPTPTTAANVTLPPGTNIALGSSANCNMAVPATSVCPYEWGAIQAAAVPGCVCQVNIPAAASDAYVYTVAKHTMAHLPGDRDIVIEYVDEIWNNAYLTNQLWSGMDWIFYPAQYSWPTNYSFAIHRTYQFKLIFEQVKAELGWGGKVRTILNVPTWATGGVMSFILANMVRQNEPATDIAQAPYWGFDYTDTQLNPDPVKIAAIHGMTVEQILDNNSWQFGYKFTSPPQASGGMKAQLDDFNNNVGGVNPNGWHLDMYGYEGGPDTLFPITYRTLAAAVTTTTQTTLTLSSVSTLVVGQYLLLDVDNSRGSATYQATSEWVQIQSIAPATNTVVVARGLNGTAARTHAAGVWWRTACFEIARDIDRHPNFYIVDHDYNLRLQQSGFKNFNLYNYSMDYAAQYQMWGAYRWVSDPPGYGDGRNGTVNNLLTLARPGQTNSKPLTKSHLLNTICVRGQGFIDWNKAVSAAPGRKKHPRYVLAGRPGMGSRRRAAGR